MKPQDYIAMLLRPEIHSGVARGGNPRADAIARYMQEEGDRSRMDVYDPAWLERNMNPDMIEEPLWSPEEQIAQEQNILSPAERELQRQDMEQDRLNNQLMQKYRGMFGE